MSKEIKAGDIWGSGEPNSYGFCKYHITAVGDDRALCYEHPFPHERNSVETKVLKCWLKDHGYLIQRSYLK